MLDPRGIWYQVGRSFKVVRVREQEGAVVLMLGDERETLDAETAQELSEQLASSLVSAKEVIP